MKQCGVVTQINDKKAKVLMQRHSSCGSCTACKMGQEDMKMEIEAINLAKAKLGQKVEVSMEHQNVLLAAFIVYIVPLTALLSGILLSSITLSLLGVQHHKEAIMLLVGFSSMAGAFLVIKRKEKKIKNNKQFTPIITKIIN